jgi:hypothetical protein
MALIGAGERRLDEISGEVLPGRRVEIGAKGRPDFPSEPQLNLFDASGRESVVDSQRLVGTEEGNTPNAPQKEERARAEFVDKGSQLGFFDPTSEGHH